MCSGKVSSYSHSHLVYGVSKMQAVIPPVAPVYWCTNCTLPLWFLPLSPHLPVLSSSRIGVALLFVVSIPLTPAGLDSFCFMFIQTQHLRESSQPEQKKVASHAVAMVTGSLRILWAMHLHAKRKPECVAVQRRRLSCGQTAWCGKEICGKCPVFHKVE